MLRSLLISLLFLVTLGLCDVDVESPTSSSTYAASDNEISVKIEWKDDGDSPNIKKATAYTFSICTGSNSDITAVDSVTVEEADVTDYSYTASFTIAGYASGNYYVQIYATYSTGYTIHYTDRFKVTGLTGSTKASGSGDPPSAENSAGAADATINSASFSITYTKQTGVSRFAPMQQQPGSTVTVTTWSRRYPTSSVTYYTTKRKSLDQVTTITPGWSYTRTSVINAATAAPFPSEVGWYAASEKLESATLDSKRRMRKRRWDD